jgi:hypothetical protein
MREGFDIFIENLGKLSVGKEVRRRKSEEIGTRGRGRGLT